MKFIPSTSKIVALSLGMLIFLCAVGGGIYFFKSGPDNKGSDLPPILEKALELNEAVKKTTIDIYNLSAKLNAASMSHSRLPDVNTAIDTIELMRQRVDENLAAIDALSSFIQKHKLYLQGAGYPWILLVEIFYSDSRVILHHESRAKFLDTFETVLTYTRDNYDRIMSKTGKRQKESYNVYYLRFRRAADSHNRLNRKRVEFEKYFVKKYPEVKPFLPGAHHDESFRFWDKFDF